jgi:periplasmic protein CpxP/Spy
MKRTIFGVLAVLVAGFLAGSTFAQAQGGPLPRHGGMMKRMVSAALEEALDQAAVSEEQRTAIHASRDRAFAAMDAQRPDPAAHRDQVLALFQSDRIDADQIQALHQQQEQRHQQVRDAVTQALVEIHDTLTPAQRTIVADYVRTHGPAGMR